MAAQHIRERFDAPLARAFALYVRALVASEVIGDVDTAMGLCGQALELTPACGYAQAELLYTLAYYSSYLGCEDPSTFVGRLEQLAGTIAPGPRRLRMQHLLDLSKRLRHSLTDTLRYWRTRRAEATRENDRFECASAEYELGKLFFAVGSWESSLEMMDGVSRAMAGHEPCGQADWCPPAFFVPAALQLGLFDIARSSMASFVKAARTRSLLWRAWMALQLDDVAACRRLMDDMQLERRTPHLILMHVAQAVLHLEIPSTTGERPSEQVRETLEMLDQLRDPQTGQCPARWEHMYAVIRFEYEGRPPMPAGTVDAALPRAVEAARILLKGRGPLMVYRPALAARCAALLDRAGHPLGAVLWQTAARWVRDSENRLPPPERAAFVAAHSVHERILARFLATG